jgi:multicomponent Na+:H+ antiporter subunit F
MTLEDLALWVAMPILSLSLILVLIRLVRGPSLPDRVVALDLIAVLTMGMIAVYVIATNRAVLLDLVTVLALLSFVGAVAFARYVEKRARP